MRRDNRSGGGRKWHTLALALHQATRAPTLALTLTPNPNPNP